MAMMLATVQMIILLQALLHTAAGSTTDEYHLYVSNTGCDSDDGSIGRPWKSLTRAQAGVRQLLQQLKLTKLHATAPELITNISHQHQHHNQQAHQSSSVSITVEVAAGKYFGTSLIFGNADTATGSAHVHWTGPTSNRGSVSDSTTAATVDIVHSIPFPLNLHQSHSLNNIQKNSFKFTTWSTAAVKLLHICQDHHSYSTAKFVLLDRVSV